MRGGSAWEYFGVDTAGPACRVQRRLRWGVVRAGLRWLRMGGMLDSRMPCDARWACP